AAKARRLVLSHVSARYSISAEELVKEAREVFKETAVAKDGMTIEVPFPDGAAGLVGVPLRDKNTQSLREPPTSTGNALPGNALSGNASPGNVYLPNAFLTFCSSPSNILCALRRL